MGDKKTLVRIIRLACSAVLLSVGIAWGQWGAPYSNDWVKHSQRYVKIQISSNGLYRMPMTSLPANFPKDKPENLQLYHRGKEVAVISATPTELVFYAVSNDGTSDSLMYRPMSSRVNKYSSIFSDKSAYFLTQGDKPGLRASTKTLPENPSITVENYHIQEELKLYTQEYSLSTSISIYPRFMNSFYEDGASKTGERRLGDTLILVTVPLPNLVKLGSMKPKLEVLFHGRSNNSRTIDIYLGKNKSELRKVSHVSLTNFTGLKREFEFDYEDINEDGSIVLGYKSDNDTFLERYSMGYYKFTYAQSYSMQGVSSKVFEIPTVAGQVKRVKLTGGTGQLQVYDISNTEIPVKIATTTLPDFYFAASKDGTAKILVTNSATTIASGQITEAAFRNFVPSSYDYIIITNDALEPSAKVYAEYRASNAGGGYKPLVVTIKELYNQFNYGEISPLAVRRFVDYLLSDNNRNKHLFIIGKSITYVERMQPDLEGDIPTIGYPGSDILLVEGLAGAPKDVPSIPVGRLSALTNEQVLNYLEKSKEYESSSVTNYEWKKKVLHINGGKTTAEINAFKGELAGLVPMVAGGALGGDVKAFVKQGLIEVEQVNITPEVNEGVGMISYMGHGSQITTDLNFDYVSTVSRGYNNRGKYPLLYFNGCGVGNIFNARLNSNLTAGDKMPLSLDWLLAKQKGAIAVIANSFESYSSPTINYLEKLYATMFLDESSDQLSIGQMQQKAIKAILDKGASTLNVSNIHQSLLQGDPALHLIRVEKPDYSIDFESGITLSSKDPSKLLGKTDSIQVNVSLSNFGKYIKSSTLDLNLKCILKNGEVVNYSRSIGAVAYKSEITFTIPNRGREIDRMEVFLDPNHKIAEVSEENNDAQLMVDWTIAENLTLYPSENLKDVIPPQLKVKANGQLLENGLVISPNPTLTFDLLDDRRINGDSTNLEIYIKNCDTDDCLYSRLNYLDNDNITFKKISNTSFEMSYNAVRLGTPGPYMILVIAKDDAGNVSEKPYQIRFSISPPSEDVMDVVVSPNPSTSYIKFSANMKQGAVSNISLFIYNANGVLQTSKTSINVNSGVYEYYWQPGETSASGLYLYKMVFSNGGVTVKEKTGKIAFVR
jgi:hypothetical protein